MLAAYVTIDMSSGHPRRHVIGVFGWPRRQIAQVKAIKTKSNIWGRILEKPRWAVNHVL